MLFAAVVGATVKLYTATAEDYPSEVESQDISKQRALEKAVKKAKKEAGVYLKSYSRSVNSELTDDEVTAITSNAWQLVGEPKFTREIINHSGDTQIIVWTATVDVNVDDSEIQSWIKRDEKDKSTIITQTNEALKSSEENDKKIEDLREKYNRATSQAEKDKIIKQMGQVDRDFLANQKLEEANKLYYAKDYHGAIKLYNESLQLNPNLAEAYNNRGTVYKDLKQYEQAIQDYDKAIELKPNNSSYYANRAIIYTFYLKNNELALADYNKGIEVEPNNSFNYGRRASFYANHLKNNELALADINKIIELEPNVYNYERRASFYERVLKKYELALDDYNKIIELKPVAQSYIIRAVFHKNILKNYKIAIQDFSKAIKLEPNNASAYQLRGICYQKLGDEAKAQADFAKAKELGYNG